MNFLDAMKSAKEGAKVARADWASNQAYIHYSNNDLTWRSLDHPDQHFHPMCNDIFGEDWNTI